MPGIASSARATRGDVRERARVPARRLACVHLRRGDFEEECAMMVDYAKAMNITWPIVMTEQDVFNTEFGVRGIPHVAIIGCDGKVAYNGLHPAGDLAKKVEKINGLLEKAGKKTPGPWKPKAEKPNADQG